MLVYFAHMLAPISQQIQRTLEEHPTLTITHAEIEKCSEIAKICLPRIPKQDWLIKKAIALGLHTFLVALERFLNKLGLIHLFQKVVSPDEIDSKGQDMILLSSIFSTLTTTIIPVLGPYHGGMMIGGIFLSLFGLSATHSLWRPFPSCMPRVENWTEKYQKGELEVGYERKDLVGEIAQSILTSPVLLIGKEGSGKTEIVRELVQAIDRGDYPHLQDTQVFYVNTADLLSYTSWIPNAHSPLSYLSKAIDGHRNRIIFVFDQIHLSLHVKGCLAEQFKTMLDFPKSHFPKLIGIAECEETLKANIGFTHRFRQIRIETSKDEIANILMQKRLTFAPDMLVECKIEKLIAEKTQNIRDALDVLQRCMEKVSSEFTEERQLLWKMKQQMYALSLSHSDDKSLAALNKILIPKLEETLIAKAKAEGVALVLNEALVDQVIHGLNLVH